MAKYDDIMAFCVVCLGLSLSDYERLTPKQINALRKAWKKNERRKDQRAALIACTIAKVHGAKVDIDDFLVDDPDIALEQQNQKNKQFLDLL